MDALKVIPQLFFDLIGRIVPGFLAMLLGLLVYYQTGHEIAWKEITETSFWVLSILAYIIGHLVSPLTKYIQRRNEDPLEGIRKVVFKPFIKLFKKEIEEKQAKAIENYIKKQKEKEDKLKGVITEEAFKQVPESAGKEGIEKKGGIRQKAFQWALILFKKEIAEQEVEVVENHIKNKIKTNNDKPDETKKEKPISDKKIRSQNYNWLRLKEPDAGAHCAKLRAEFTMYNSFAAIFLIFSVAEFAVFSVVSVEQHDFNLMSCILVIVSIVLFFAMASRGHEGEGTFSDNVEEFYKAANLPTGPPPIEVPVKRV